MKYMGSKRRIAKDILPIVLKNRKEGQVFYDLFAGGFNIIDKVDNPRVANDNNTYIISLFKELQNEYFEFPEHIGEEKYKDIQKNKDNYPEWLVGYVGFNLSFAAKFFGGYGRDKMGIRNYENEAKRNLKLQQNLIKGIELYNLDYKNVPLKPNSIIYCDIPYNNTTKYTTSKEFNYEEFYNWCIEKNNEGHEIYISEYEMPEDKFKCIWQKEIGSSLDLNTGSKKNVEKLFIVR